MLRRSIGDCSFASRAVNLEAKSIVRQCRRLRFKLSSNIVINMFRPELPLPSHPKALKSDVAASPRAAEAASRDFRESKKAKNHRETLESSFRTGVMLY